MRSPTSSNSFTAIVEPGGRVDQLPQFLQAHAKAGEAAQHGAVPQRALGLVVAEQAGFALHGQRIGAAQHLGERRAAQVAGAAFGDGIAQGHAFGRIGVVGGHLQAFDVHGEARCRG